ncbi:putative 2-oxoglutarate/Fe(II)-dependent dioxygenase [Morus notabilis]|uniref:Putative 2-oxoglutarate/Fe(II)-dependent dioxygenase n=1 Tax=Morus notabilis TaxID=981085 RepID=W9SEA5_9ROSA|nr:putative 2-oxoglutarate/Fe(II)-dependent dioxygenase [Morus notabilis]
MISIKSLAESPELTSIPASYTFTSNPNEYPALLPADPEVNVPIIDLALLTFGTSDQRSKVINELGNACENWGFFIVTNHGVPESLMDAVMDGCRGFFYLCEDDKLEFKGDHVMDPIRCGTSFNASIEKEFYWRDFLKVFVHPQFHFPNKPSGFSPFVAKPPTATLTPRPSYREPDLLLRGLPVKNPPHRGLPHHEAILYSPLPPQPPQSFSLSLLSRLEPAMVDENVGVREEDVVRGVGATRFLDGQGESNLALEYCKRIREVAKDVLEGISESLGMESNYINKALNLDSNFQIFIANLYPPCPQPELAMGLPPHSDHGLLTFLTQNGIGGLQIQHNGKWVSVNPIPNSFLINTGDHLEILSNGKFKSVVHRAIVNRNSTRISLAIANGPSLDTVVTPAAELVDSHNIPPAYIGIKYKEYIQLQQSNNLKDKSVLDRIRSI